MMQKGPFYVYIILCKDCSYYTGYAKNLERRIKQHKKGKGAKYTIMHEPEKIAYVEKFDSRKKAMRRERMIKSFSHSKKKRLCDSYMSQAS